MVDDFLDNYNYSGILRSSRRKDIKYDFFFQKSETYFAVKTNYRISRRFKNLWAFILY